MTLDDYNDAIEQVGSDLTSGYLDETEAVQRLIDLGHTAAGAQHRVNDWQDSRD